MRQVSITIFLPGHPIAGRSTGVEHRGATLFKGEIILRPEVTDSDAVETITAMWALTGAYIRQCRLRPMPCWQQARICPISFLMHWRALERTMQTQ